MNPTTAKSHGIHYTPPELAQFLARLLAERCSDQERELRVLDPACGDGALLAAFARAVPASVRERLTLVGYETDPPAIDAADSVLRRLAVKEFTLVEGDFLEACAGRLRRGDRKSALCADTSSCARRAGLLAARFGLTGRVDLYHAFARAMAGVLKPGGVLGLLASNRFLTVKSGAGLRVLLRTQFTLQAIYDLGDTKLFAAAVLPVIVVATKKPPATRVRCRFDRVYQARPERRTSPRASHLDAAQADSDAPIQPVQSVLAALRDGKTEGLVRAPTGLFRVERGFLPDRPADAIWTLSNADSERWLKVVRRHAGPTFDDVGRVRVGIKTTADQVFIRDDWQLLPLDRRPEQELLRPLLTAFWGRPLAGRCAPTSRAVPTRRDGGAAPTRRSGSFSPGKPIFGRPSAAVVAKAVRRRQRPAVVRDLGSP